MPRAPCTTHKLGDPRCRGKLDTETLPSAHCSQELAPWKTMPGCEWPGRRKKTGETSGLCVFNQTDLKGDLSGDLPRRLAEVRCHKCSICQLTLCKPQVTHSKRPQIESFIAFSGIQLAPAFTLSALRTCLFAWLGDLLWKHAHPHFSREHMCLPCH